MKNYVVRSIKSRPVLFAVTAILSILLTYVLMDNWAEITYEKQVKIQQETIFKLQQKVVSLETTISKVNTIIDEEFDKDTGKLLRKKTRQNSEKATKKSIKKETIQEVIAKKAKEIYERESKKSEKRHNLLAGYGLSNKLSREIYLGYTYRYLIFDIGIIGRTNTYMSDFGAGILMGLRF